MSEAERLRRLRAETDPAAACDLALDLIQTARRRETLDAALHRLESAALDHDARPALRTAALRFFNHEVQDSGALIREKLVRMLVSIGSPDDRDIYLRGVHTYEAQPVTDVVQNLRAAALVGLAMADPTLGNLHAVRLLNDLGETSVFNGEPAVTAVSLLQQQGHALPIYGFLLASGVDALEAGLNEAVGRALEALGPEFPPDLYRSLAELFIPRDRAVVSLGIVAYIVEQRAAALYDIVERVMTTTRHDELHHFCAVTLAASREPALTALLYRLAQTSPQRHIGNYIEALELLPGDEKNDAVAALKRRL